MANIIWSCRDFPKATVQGFLSLVPYNELVCGMSKDVTRLPIYHPDGVFGTLFFLVFFMVNINQDMCLVSQAVGRHQNHSTDYMCVQGIMLNTFFENFTHKHLICIIPATASQSSISFCNPSLPFQINDLFFN